MVKIVVDSGCTYFTAMKNELNLNVELVPLNLQVEDEHFIDDQNIDIDKYISAMEASSTTPKTAAPSPELYLDAYRGEESVFAITLSSKLSGSYNSAELAKEMYLSDVGNKFIHVCDSLSAAVGEALIAMKIIEFSKLEFSDMEIKEKITEFIANMETFFILEKFDNLVKTGRMNPYIAKLASMLSIKPICKAEEGSIILVDKARGYNKAAQKLIDTILSQNKNFEELVLAIMHVKDYDRALSFKNEILKKKKFKDVIISETSGLCATYAMRNGLIVCY